MQGKLTKLSKNENELRTNSMEGEFWDPPIRGKRFAIIGEGIEFGDRVIYTSIVKEVKQTELGYEFDTEFSTYRLETVIN